MATTKDASERGIGPRVRGWIADMVKKGASGAWEMGKGAGKDLLIAALKAYLGLPP